MLKGELRRSIDLRDFARALRFGVVGLLATVTYFLATDALGRPPFNIEPVAASTIGFVLSMLASYIGHHKFTFQVNGRHGYYFPRFLTVTGVLFLCTTTVVAIFTRHLGYNRTLVTAVIAVCYPVISYGLNFLWAFTHKVPA